MRLYYCDQFPIPLPPGHKFPVEKYGLLRAALENTNEFDLRPAPLADPRQIRRVHDPAYVDAFLSGTLSQAAVRRIGLPWSESLVKRTLASVGSTLQATEDALEFGSGGGLAGGTHHAFRNEGAGFCVFNDIAVAFAHARGEGGIHRAAVIDLDVHQGDGTAAMLAGEPGVFTFSVHSASNFPFRKQQSSLDVELPDGTGDEEYLDALEASLPRVWEFAPDIIWYQAGVDALASDRLGKLALTMAGMAERDRMVFHGCRAAGIPLVVTLGGGYSTPVENTVAAHVQTFRLAARIFHESYPALRSLV